MHTHECRGCNAHYDSIAWASLALVETLRPDQLGDIFTEWPWSHKATLEMRRCMCGATLASLDPRTDVERAAPHAA